MTEETRLKLVKAATGRKMTEETRLKMSNSAKNRK